MQKILIQREPHEINNHLQDYVELCLKEGASEAAIISQKDIFLDPRSPMKCLQPKCMHFNTCANCPPQIPDFNTFSKIIMSYNWAVIYRCKMRLSENNIEDRKKVARIVKAVESAAFYDGFYFAMGFGAGTCKKTWCPDKPCQALIPGKGCRFPLESRVSMEAAGFDVFKILTNLGWDVYPIGKNCPEGEAPYMSRVGVVLIY